MNITPIRTAAVCAATALLVGAGSSAWAADDYMDRTKTLRVAATGNADKTWVVIDATSSTVTVRYTLKGKAKTVTYPVKKWGGAGQWGSAVKSLPGNVSKVTVINTKTGSKVTVTPAESDKAKWRPGSGKNSCGGDPDPCPYWA